MHAGSLEQQGPHARTPAPFIACACELTTLRHILSVCITMPLCCFAIHVPIAHLTRMPYKPFLLEAAANWFWPCARPFLCVLQASELVTQGPLWFPDLTVTDPYKGLSIVCATLLSIQAVIATQPHNMPAASPKAAKWFRYVTAYNIRLC